MDGVISGERLKINKKSYTYETCKQLIQFVSSLYKIQQKNYPNIQNSNFFKFPKFSDKTKQSFTQNYIGNKPNTRIKLRT